MINCILKSNVYKSPFGSANLQNNICSTIEKNNKKDTFLSRNSKQLKSAGKFALILGSIAALFKNRTKIGPTIKKFLNISPKKKFIKLY